MAKHTVGIDAISFDIPRIYLPIRILAEKREIDPEKLTKGLGLERMSILDLHQDVVTMASNAVLRLLRQQKMNPEDVGRLYVGTESGVDGSKPIASYVLSNLKSIFGDAFRNCDGVDLTFACIGGVDALENCLDYVKLRPDKKAIVVTTDFAKYDLGSTGEYTQGAGAIALLVSANPRLISIDGEFGVATEGVFDFFKPRRYFPKQELGIDIPEEVVSVYREQPVFDGQYSNACYIKQIKEAYSHFKVLNGKNGIGFDDWSQILMHLPYCYQARRTFVEIYADELTHGNEAELRDMRAIAKSAGYLEFVQNRIQPSEMGSAKVGNIYTGSIFLGLLSTLSYLRDTNENIEGRTFGFLAYGSGSKAKVFEGRISKEWRAAMDGVDLFGYLDELEAIDFGTYEDLYCGRVQNSVIEPKEEFVLLGIERENPNQLGARMYQYYP